MNTFSAGIPLCEMLSEGEEITVTSGCLSLFAEDVSFTLLFGLGAEALPGLTQHLKEQLVLSGLVIQQGMTMVLQYLTQEVALRVKVVKMFGMEVKAETPFRCLPQTRVCVQMEEKNTKVSNPEVSFEDIGGYESEIGNIRQLISALFSEGPKRDVPRGMLISGPSGCGKTLIGKVLKAKYGRKFLPVPLEEVKSRYVGETEQNLTHYFSEASKRCVFCLVHSP